MHRLSQTILEVNFKSHSAIGFDSICEILLVVYLNSQF